MSLTFSPTRVPQRGLVCTLFSGSMVSTMNQDTKAGHSETVWLALTMQSLGKEGLSRLSPLNSLPLNELFHCVSGAILGDTADLYAMLSNLGKSSTSHISTKPHFLDLWIRFTGLECLGHRYDNCTYFIFLSSCQEILHLELTYRCHLWEILTRFLRIRVPW